MSLMPTTGEGRDYLGRLAWTLLVGVGALLVLAARLYVLQVVEGEEFAERSRSNFVKQQSVPADRGMILDRNRTILADARPSFDLELTPAFTTDAVATLERLADSLDLDPVVVLAARERIDAADGLERFRAIRIARDIGRDRVDWVQAHQHSLDGVEVRIRPQRNYRFGASLYHLLGYMNEISREELEEARAAGLDYRLGDSLGRSGLEERFEDRLRGEDGLEQFIVDAKGRRIETVGLGAGDESMAIPDPQRLVEPVPGLNLILSIDSRLQRAADEAFPGQAGSVVALDPQTGYVLAMLSRPGVDPNRLGSGLSPRDMRRLREDPLEPMLHRAIQQHYHPGSTFKVFTALAALADGTATATSSTGCNGGYRLGRRRWRCWRAGGHGTVALNKAIQHSCDTYFYWLGDRMDIDPIAHWARASGLGSPTGIGLPHEIGGIIPDVEYHDRVSEDGYQRGFALNTAIGQGDVNVTPLQLALSYAAIGNGGTVYRPQLVRRVETASGEVVEEFLPEVTGRIGATPEHLELVVQGLRSVVMEPGGTAYYRYPRREGFTVEVAGKTGTAQVVKLGEKREKTQDMDYWERDHAWFAAFAPVEEPEIAVVVLNEHGGHGSSGAAPTAMKVLQTYFALKAEDEAKRASRLPPPAPPPPAEAAPRPSPRPARDTETVDPDSPAQRHATPEPVPVVAPPAHVDTG